jgi:hypothetical protein
LLNVDKKKEITCMAVSESAIVQLLDAEESRDFVENEVLAPSSQDPAIEYFLRLVMVSFFFRYAWD